jgi:PAS domain S-box-containing protein
MMRPDGRIIEVNNAAVAAYGYEREELLGMSLSDLRHPSTHGLLAEQLQAAATGGAHFETIHVKKDGTTFPVEVSSTGAEIAGEFILMSIIRDVTERAMAEAVLRESQERFAKAFNASPLVVTITSLRTGKLTEVNQTFVDVTGFSREETIGRSTAELGLWDRNVDRTAELEELQRVGSVRNKEYSFRLKNGTELIGLLSAEVLEIGGEPSALTVIQDVTERKRSEETLRRSEQRLQQMADAMPQIVWVADRDGTVTYYNNRVSEYAGFEHNSDGSWNWSPAVHPEDAAKTVEAWSEAVRKGTVYSIEHRLAMKDGSIRWQLSRAVPIRDADGNILQWYGTATDIHDIRQAQEAVVAAERQAAEEYQRLLTRIVPLAETLGAARDLVTIYRSMGDFVRASMPCSAFFVSFFDPATRLRTAAYVWGEDGELDVSLLPPIELTRDGGPNSQAVYEKRSVIVNSYMDWMSGRPHIVFNENGVDPMSSIAVPMIVMDRVTGTLEVQAYENYAFSDEHVVALEMAANLAAVAIENVRLIEIEAEARAAAESANLAKDEFLSVLSHELRTPLNAMLGWVRMLRSDVLDKESAAKALEVIERNTRLQGSLIEDLLDVSRIISGKMRIETEAVDLLTVIRTVSETVRPLAASKEITYVTEAADDNIFLHADPVRLQQVVSNLVQNAIKFTPAGGKVSVAATRAGGEAVLTVTDSGIGIDAEFLPYIFDRFRQADASTKRNYTGLGLGLTITKTIVALHGGDIEVESGGPDKGSVFRVRLPLADEFYSRSAEAEEILTTGGSSLSGVRILLVDDDAESLGPIKLFLEGEDAAIETAGSAAEALEKFLSGGFDVLISDIGMPQTDGYELIRSIRSTENGGPSIKAIALTAYASEDDREKVFAAGFQSHLAKPVSFDELLRTLASLL